MTFIKLHKKIISTTALLLTLCVILIVFGNMHLQLNIKAATYATETKKDALKIPSDMNFISDDKKAFIDYCKNIYNLNQTLSIDNTTYVYYGNVGGYRFYRMNVDALTPENINQEKKIGGFLFTSAQNFRPYSLGLYIISDDDTVYTLEEAYQLQLVDINQIYKLFLQKS